ncbi:hypothetical protein Hanom_Chr15g01370611 [Helianthus anomalus]
MFDDVVGRRVKGGSCLCLAFTLLRHFHSPPTADKRDKEVFLIWLQTQYHKHVK